VHASGIPTNLKPIAEVLKHKSIGAHLVPAVEGQGISNSKFVDTKPQSTKTLRRQIPHLFNSKLRKSKGGGAGPSRPCELFLSSVTQRASSKQESEFKHTARLR
jgi:hypothetical protein